MWSKKSQKSTKKSTESEMTMSSRGLAEIKRQHEQRKSRNPLRKLLFRPKVYAFWKEEDLEGEIEQRAKFLTGVKEKESRLMDKKRKKKKEDIGEADEDEDSEENTAEATFERLKSRQEREMEHKSRMDAEHKRVAEEKRRADDAKMLDEINHPSKYVKINKN